MLSPKESLTPCSASYSYSYHLPNVTSRVNASNSINMGRSGTSHCWLQELFWYDIHKKVPKKENILIIQYPFNECISYPCNLMHKDSAHPAQAMQSYCVLQQLLTFPNAQLGVLVENQVFLFHSSSLRWNNNPWSPIWHDVWSPPFIDNYQSTTPSNPTFCVQ